MSIFNNAISAIISIPKKDKIEYEEMKDKLFQWAECHLEYIIGRYVLDFNKIIVVAKKNIFSDLPEFVTWQKYTPEPVTGLFADMGDHSYIHETEKINGSKHFSPGTSLYIFAPHAGDGYERTYMIGLDRNTHHLIKIIGSTKRLINWRIEKAVNPAMIYLASGGPGHSWDNFSMLEIEEFAKVMNERQFSDDLK